ncbi:MAG: bifunctional DNA-formamidopyrimidine glycosylase/DNA-(apurinic or apyrimidinic site) lyase [Dehalococcoidia bacterium]
MPELPEVETIKNELAPWIVGQSFTDVAILDARLVWGGSPEELRCGLVGQRVEGLARRGKYLIFHLSSGRSLIVHLRMTGSLLLNPREADRYVRAVFQFSNGKCLALSDRRRLGLIWLVDDAGTAVGKLGPEPLGGSLTADILRQRLSRHRIPIKAALLDQRVVAGIGNMYADEALFAAGIHPLRRANELSAEEVRTLHNCIRRVLEAAIGCKGASVDTYVRPRGELGTAHCDFRVAHRGGQPCPVCGSTIERVAIQNRGSYFCPHCQPIGPGQGT